MYPRVAVLVAFVLLFNGALQQASALSSSQVTALNALSAGWSVSPPLKWSNGDPCFAQWEGVTCDPTNSTVTHLVLIDRGISGQISSAIGGLTALIELEMSNNTGLFGPIPSEIGQCTALQRLSLQQCSITGPLPSELGNLAQLYFLGLNVNKITGPMPASLGKTPLTWLDVSSNMISGPIPISGANNPIGLDNITTIQHFHLNNNSLNGSVPAEFFSLPNIVHVLLNYNELSGNLPNFTNWSPTLEIIRLDGNNLQGPIHDRFGDAPALKQLYLGNNQFTKTVPNLSDIEKLYLLDLSYNNFDPAPFPDWVLDYVNITTLNLAGMNITGNIPPALFDLEPIQGIDLSNNKLNGSLTFESITGPLLVTIDLENNDLNGFSGEPNNPDVTWNITISLQGNRICTNTFFSLPGACEGEAAGTWKHPTVNSSCSGQTNSVCDDNKSLNWYTCRCGYPLQVVLLLTAPYSTNLDKVALSLEKDLASHLDLFANQTFVSDMIYEQGAVIEATVDFFPVSGDTLSKDVSDNITISLRQHRFNIQEGPYLVLVSSTAAGSSSSGLSTAAIIGITVGVVLVFLIVAGSVVFAVVQKRRADKAVSNNPFASWGGGSAEFGEAPKLKGARWFSLAELKQYTNNWSEDNMIGVGGYGKVYRGELPNGDVVAIKRATEGSMQGANEFKNEIELLSRVHHRNLVGLVGFCYEGGEQALIYEFMINGTLTDHLKTYLEVPLSWEARLEIALASAIGINYLHDHATPPIIHRDIKSANILLNEKMVAKVADFGLSKLAPDEGEKLVHSVNVKGTLGYLDPEYYMTQNLTDKSDVYSFGVVLLEMLTARPPIDQGRFVVREFRNALDRGGIEALRPLMDPSLQGISTKDLEPYLKIALSCVEEDSASRPTTAEIVKQLQALDFLSKPKAGVRGMDIEAGAKKVKFADDFESDQQDLLSSDMAPKPSQEPTYPYQRAPDSFRYSGAYGVSTTVKPK